MTAVEWLFDKYITQNGVIAAADYHTAKEMEKQQIIEANEENMMSFTDGEKYYNATFKSE